MLEISINPDICWEYAICSTGLQCISNDECLSKSCDGFVQQSDGGVVPGVCE